MIKIQWLASIWRQNDQNVELRCKTFKTNLNYKSDQNPMTCIDWMSKRSKQRYSTKVIKIQWLASIWRQNDQNVELRYENICIDLNKVKTDQNVEVLRKTFKTTQNYKSDQITMNCIDLTSKRSKCWATLQNIQNKPKLQKWSKSNDLHRLDVQKIKTEVYYKSHQNPMTCIDLTSKRSKCWVTSQNIQNKAKLQKWSKSNDLHRFDVKTIKTFKTKLNYKSDQNPMSCIDLTSKRSKCWVTSQNIRNKAKLQKWSKSNELHRFDVKTIKTFKTTLNYKSDQITMNCIDLTSKRSKCWATLQNIQNKPKLQKWSKSNDLHRLDVKTIKTFKTKLNYKSDQNPMTCIDLTSKRSKCWVTSQNIQNKAKLQKWSKSNDLHRFDVKTIKTFKTKLNYKSDQNPMSCIDLTSKRSKHSKQS